VTAKLVSQSSGSLTFSVQMVRGDGRNLSRSWVEFKQAKIGLGASLPRRITLKTKTPRKLLTGNRYGFYISMRLKASSPRTFEWYRPQPKSLTKLGQFRGPRVDQAQLETQISRLASRSFAKRERASAALVRCGPSALAILLKAKTHKDLEVRSRARRLLARLRTRQGIDIEAMVRRQSLQP